MRIALVGAGAMGTIIGALIAKGGEDIVMVDVNEPHVKALNEKGATITGHMDITVPVNAVTPDGMEGTYDLVIYLVKTTYDDKALPEILPFIGDGSMVITLQNGVPEERVAAVVGRERTLGGAIGWGATFIGPGVSELTYDPVEMTYDIGELDGSLSKRIKAVKGVLDLAGSAEISDNLVGTRWVKLMVNVSMSGLSAALDCTYGDILDNDKVTEIIRGIEDRRYPLSFDNLDMIEVRPLEEII